jgi:glutamine synthetase
MTIEQQLLRSLLSNRKGSRLEQRIESADVTLYLVIAASLENEFILNIDRVNY